MKRFKTIILHIVFTLTLVVILYANMAGNDLLEHWFKPLLMPVLAIYLTVFSKGLHREMVVLMLLAILFSWGGDILLMYTSQSEKFFLFGLSSFLLAQICYINLFRRSIVMSGKKPFLKKKAFYLIPYIAFGLIFYILLYDELSALLKVGVFVYMTAILSMSAMALNRFGNGHPISFSMVFSGSILFVLSDSIIALDKFLFPINDAGFYIMLTYGIAQYLIVTGIVKQYE